MIFDNDKTLKLIQKWKYNEDKDILSDILEECNALVGVIVSRFDNIYRDDLMQESYVRIHYSLRFYNEEKGHLHKYLTSVIHNACLSYLSKESRHFQLTVNELNIGGEYISINGNTEQSLTDMIVRNRDRFPSMPTDMIDDMSEFVFYSILDGIDGKSRGAIRELTHNFSVLRSVATVVYHSSLVYLRTNYFMDQIDISIQEPNEFSLSSDIKTVIGSEAFDILSVIFSGMYIKFP